jgi:hypothetical protein
MTRLEVAELIQNGENSGVEFKRDDVVPERLAKEMAALLNLKGGYILLGVEKDRSVSGLTRDPEKAEEWVMEIARTHLRPAAIPFWETQPMTRRPVSTCNRDVYRTTASQFPERLLPISTCDGSSITSGMCAGRAARMPRTSTGGLACSLIPS